MVKSIFHDQLLAEWFIKSLLPSITEDVAKGGIVTEEQVISRAQYLDFIYTQSGTLYEKIPNVLRSNFTVPPPSKDSHASDDMIGTTSTHHSTHMILHLLLKFMMCHLTKAKVTSNPEVRKSGNQRKKNFSPIGMII